MLRLLIAKKVWKKHPLLLHHPWRFFFSFFLSGFFLFLFQCWWWPRNGSKHHHVSDFRRLSPKTINYTRAYLFCLPATPSPFFFFFSLLALNLDSLAQLGMRKSQQQERGEKKKQPNKPRKRSSRKCLKKNELPHIPNSQTLRNASHHALSQAVRTHTTNEQAQTHPLSFLSFFRDRSLLTPPVFGHPGKKKKNPRLVLIREMRLPKAKGKEVGGGGELCSCCCCCCWKEIPNGQKACPRFSQARFLLLHVSF